MYTSFQRTIVKCRSSACITTTDMGNHRAFNPLCLRELRRRSTSSVMKCHLEQTEVSCRVQRTGKPEGFGNASNNTSEECGISGEAAKGHNSTRSAVELSDEADIPSTLKMQVFQVTTRLSTCYWGPTLNQSTTTPPLRLREYSQRPVPVSRETSTEAVHFLTRWRVHHR